MARVWTSGPPDSGMEIPDRKAGTEEIRVSYAVDGHCAPRIKCVGRPAPASARGHRPHPLDVQRQAHEVPLAAHLRQASQAESSESEPLLDPPVRRLREPLALRVPGFARGARQFLTHAVRGREPGRVDRHLGLAFTPQRYVRVDAAIFQLPSRRFAGLLPGIDRDALRKQAAARLGSTISSPRASMASLFRRSMPRPCAAVSIRRKRPVCR